MNHHPKTPANYQISFQPSVDELMEIKLWLVTEQEQNADGFLCNWKTIEWYFTQKSMAIIIVENKVLGFMVWDFSEGVSQLQIAEVKPGYRKKGYGRALLEAVISYLIKKNVVVLTLFCQPANSYLAWKALGFESFPDLPDFGHLNSVKKKQMFSILVPYLEPCKEVYAPEHIELWAAGTQEVLDKQANWMWEPILISGTRVLTTPIIWPVNYDWRLIYFRTDVKVKDGKVKNFDKSRIDIENFMIIKSLPEV